ncbi:MAG: helix-turn-helix domain-containing protein [Rubrobacteraceae bacterium]
MNREPVESIVVRDFVEDSELGLELVVDGNLELPVSWVHVTELLDPSPYVQGGELILSAGVWNAHDGRPDAFVGALADARASGLGWGLLPDGDSVPDAVIEACRAAGLTLLAVPTRTPFIAIGRRFFELVQAQREAKLRSTIDYGERLIRSISSLPGGLRGILNVLREEVRKDVWVVGADGRILAEDATVEPPLDVISSVVSLAVQNHEALYLKSAAVFDIGTGGGAPSYLLVDVPPGEIGLEHRSKIEQALPLLDFVLAHERELREAERRLATELVDAVLSKRTQFSAGRLEAYGLDPLGSFVAVVTTSGRPRSILEATKQAISPLAENVVVAVWRDTVTAVVQPHQGSPLSDEIGRSLRAALGPDSAIGIGAGGRGVEGLRRSLIQARQSSNFARSHRVPEGYVIHDKAESHALLLALQDEQVLESFCDSLLGPIEEYDARRDAGLLLTLETFLASGGQWQATADKLRVHVNTLRHRLSRCEGLTGRDLSSMDDRVDFYIATKARHTNRHTTRGPTDAP